MQKSRNIVHALEYHIGCSCSSFPSSKVYMESELYYCPVHVILVLKYGFRRQDKREREGWLVGDVGVGLWESERREVSCT